MPNLIGDRDIEHLRITPNMPEGLGLASDFGSRQVALRLLAARKGFSVISIDLEPVIWYDEPLSLKFLQEDILKLALQSYHYDVDVNCSPVQHVGLPGGRRVTESISDGDIEAMAVRKILLTRGEFML